MKFTSVEFPKRSLDEVATAIRNAVDDQDGEKISRSVAELKAVSLKLSDITIELRGVGEGFRRAGCAV